MKASLPHLADNGMPINVPLLMPAAVTIGSWDFSKYGILRSSGDSSVASNCIAWIEIVIAI